MEDKSSTNDEETTEGSFFNISRPRTPPFLAEAFNALLQCLGLGGHPQRPGKISQECSSSKQEEDDDDDKACAEETLQDPPPAATTTTADPQADPPTVDSVEDAPANIVASLARRGGRGPPISRGGGGQINSVATQSS